MASSLCRVAAVLLSSSMVFLSGCAPQATQTVGAYTVGGALVGGTAGAIIGREVNNDNADLIGAASGAVIGGVVGNSMDRQRTLERQVYGGGHGQPQPSYYPY